VIVAFGPADPPVRIEVPDTEAGRAVAALMPSVVEAAGPGAPESGPPGAGAGSVGAAVASGARPALRLEELGPEDWLFTAPDRPPHRSDYLPDLLSHVEDALTDHLMRGLPEFTQLHGAGAVVEGRAVLVVGESGAGKSSLALAWSRMGLPLLGDDVILMDEAGRLHSFPRIMKVFWERLLEHGIDPETTLGYSQDSYELWYDPRTGGGWGPGPALPAVVARVRFDAGAGRVAPGFELEPLPTADMVQALLAGAFEPGRPPADSFATLVEALADATCLEVTFGSSVALATHLADLARSSRP
jgi:hypothetical protein